MKRAVNLLEFWFITKGYPKYQDLKNYQYYFWKKQGARNRSPQRWHPNTASVIYGVMAEHHHTPQEHFGEEAEDGPEETEQFQPPFSTLSSDSATHKIQQVKKPEYCCSLRAPPTHYKFGSDWPRGDDFSCFSSILLLPVSVLIFTHFSPNYCNFSKQYLHSYNKEGGKKKASSG